MHIMPLRVSIYLSDPVFLSRIANKTLTVSSMFRRYRFPCTDKFLHYLPKNANDINESSFKIRTRPGSAQRAPVQPGGDFKSYLEVDADSRDDARIELVMAIPPEHYRSRRLVNQKDSPYPRRKT